MLSLLIFLLLRLLLQREGHMSLLRKLSKGAQWVFEQIGWGIELKHSSCVHTRREGVRVRRSVGE
jgi:hypothetical protein